MDQATIKLYRQKFDDLRNQKYFVLNTETKYWYKKKLKWRLTFRGEDGMRYNNFYHFSNMKSAIEKIDPDCRTRMEHTFNVFTNSTTLLDAVIQEEEFRKYLIQATHADGQYEEALANLDGIAVDVKFQSPKRYNPELKYMVEFTWDFGMEKNTFGQVMRNNKKQKVMELAQYCKANSDSLIPNANISRTKDYAYYWHGPLQVWVKDEAQIPLLYVMFGQIYKVYKLVKKEKNNEQQSCTSTN